MLAGHHGYELIPYNHILYEFILIAILTLLKDPMIKETGTGSSTNARLISFPIPSVQGISLIILRVIGLEQISIKCK